jgi:hypothetical protein
VNQLHSNAYIFAFTIHHGASGLFGSNRSAMAKYGYCVFGLRD